jgi:hypothetical protein
MKPASIEALLAEIRPYCLGSMKILSEASSGPLSRPDPTCYDKASFDADPPSRYSCESVNRWLATSRPCLAAAIASIE